MNEKKNLSKNSKAIAVRALTATAKLLIEICELGVDFDFLTRHRCYDSHSVRLARFEHGRYLAREQYYLKRQALKRLQERKLVALRKEGNRVIAKLTQSGKVKALQTIIRFSVPDLADAKICLVSFDFPESARAARNNFRYFLKKTGFRFVQGSVWSIGKDARVQIRELIRILKISKWVEVYTVVK